MSVTETMTLTDFLLARIAEDEHEVGSLRLYRQRSTRLVECEAKRRIVELATETFTQADAKVDEQIERSFNAGAAFVAHNALIRLAAVYADHPDYREEWRP